MNVAAVINVASGEAALSRATQTQTLLLEHLGHQLGSIRLAVPRLLKFACLGAVAEKPDVLVVAGGPRAARRAAQIAYAHGLPILFLPGQRSPAWASRLWGSLSVEGMVAALAQEAVTPLWLPAGSVGGHMFFGSASCGLLPQIAQLRDDLAGVGSVPAAARLLGRTAAASGIAFCSRIAIRCHGAPRSADAIVVGTQPADAAASSRVARLGSFDCAAWRLGPLALARASLRAAAGGDWHDGREPERFNCTKLTLQAGATTWLVLDGETIAFRGLVELRYLPKAVETFAFASNREQSAPRRRYSFRAAPMGHGTASGSPTFVSRA